MRQPRLHPLAILVLAGLIGFFGGYVNEAFARDHGARPSFHHRGADFRGVPQRGFAGRQFSGERRGMGWRRGGEDGGFGYRGSDRPGFSGSPQFSREQGGTGWRRGGEDRGFGSRGERRPPFAYQSGGPSWRYENRFRRDGFAHRDYGWRDRRDRFDDHDRRKARHFRDDYRRGWERPTRPLRRYDHQYGNEIAPLDRSWNSSARTIDDDGVIYLGSGAFDDAAFSTAGTYPSGARWIDVSTERLDRRPIGRDGIDIAVVGGSKVIRLGPQFSARSRQRDADLQPWSSAWLRHCSATYRSFDPALGTYVARGGRVRFCNP
jgi:hypothetical protein